MSKPCYCFQQAFICLQTKSKTSLRLLASWPVSALLLLAALLLVACSPDPAPQVTVEESPTKEQKIVVVAPSATRTTLAAATPSPSLTATVERTVEPATATPIPPSPTPSPSPLPSALPSASPSGTATSTSLPTATATRTGTPTSLPTFVPEWYNIQSGDTLLGIAINHDLSVEELLEFNNFTEETPIIVGQTVALPPQVSTTLPQTYLIHDSEVVNGPDYVEWDTSKFVKRKGGELAKYSRNGRSGAEIIDMVADRYYVGPRALLALMEIASGWVTKKNPSLAQPFGQKYFGNADLEWQATWAAKKLMEGYYGQLEGRRDSVVFANGSLARLYPGTNPGSAGVANVLAAIISPDELTEILEKERFEATYKRLFGEIEGGAVMPPEGKQPYFALPWQKGEQWIFTGGPHGGYGDDYSGWAALDFAPPVPTGCYASVFPVRAAAPGVVIKSEDGQLWVDLDKDGDIRTGWVILYMHLATAGRAEVGTQVQTGDIVGFPSCEGGISTASHLHMARMYNGQWMPAHTPVPFQLGNWIARALIGVSYDGTLVKTTGTTLESCDCRNPNQNVFPINYDQGLPMPGR
ncbi:MAG: peptidoglycan DD-metalloendopeptidase family protein [Ardenticatenaceae bacterium]